MPVPRGGSGMPGGGERLDCAPDGRAKNGKRRSKGEFGAAPADASDCELLATGCPPQREKNPRRGFETGTSLTTRSPETVSPPTIPGGGGGNTDGSVAAGGAKRERTVGGLAMFGIAAGALYCGICLRYWGGSCQRRAGTFCEGSMGGCAEGIVAGSGIGKSERLFPPAGPAACGPKLPGAAAGSTGPAGASDGPSFCCSTT